MKPLINLLERWNTSLQVRIVGFFTVCLLLVISSLLATSVWINNQAGREMSTHLAEQIEKQTSAQKQLLNNNLEQKIGSMANLITLISVDPIMNFDYEVLNGYVSSGANDPDIGYISILDLDGNVLATSEVIEVDSVKKIPIKDGEDTIGIIEVGVVEKTVIQAVTEVAEQMTNLQTSIDHQNSDAQTKTTLWSSALGVVLLIVAFIISFKMIHSIILSLNEVIDAANKIANGELSFQVSTNSLDETGQLLNTIEQMRNKLTQVIEGDMQKIIDSAKAGDLTRRIDLDDKSGFYNKLSLGINQLLDVNEMVLNETLHVFSAMAQGDLNKTIDIEFQGDFDKLKQNANQTVEKLTEVIEGDIQNLVDAARLGDLTQRIELVGKEGFFKNLSSSINEMVDVNEQIIGDLANVMSGLSRGDLTNIISNDYLGVFDHLKNDTNNTISKLTKIISNINHASSSVETTANEIATGNQDLSQRTEKQASMLEQTAASMEEFSITIQQNSENAREASALSLNAQQIAEGGGTEINKAIETMEEINQSSNKIAGIIGVIDEIAFQTNLLAINAAIEAARAGEHGRGFAVVAKEVRNLASRSTDAAKDIKNLIFGSLTSVNEGTKRVNESGEILNQIVDSVAIVNQKIYEISVLAKEQSNGIQAVNTAITQMDEMTQQNATLVEQAAAATESMSEEAINLKRQVQFFTIKST